MYDLIVIGGGPAGMLASATAAGLGLKVVLLEKNEKLGKKLFLTGKGRCNLTNAGDMENFINNVTTNGKFLYSAFRAFSNRDLVDLVEKLGVPTKVERGDRVFPASDKSSDITSALKKHMEKSGVQIKTQCVVKDIVAQEGCVKGVNMGDQLIPGKSILLCTGGLSYPATGSTGDGYRLAKNLGHTIIEPRASLVPLETVEEWPRELQGLTLKNVEVSAHRGEQEIISLFGELLFTHFGVSGPTILTLSSHLNSGSRGVKISIDLKPALKLEKLQDRLQRDLVKHGAKQMANALHELLPQRLIPIVLTASGIEQNKMASQVTREERRALANTLKGLALTIKGTRPLREAIITSGGISTREIDPKTMGSKLIKGLYFAGEIIDADALTGGYNLQIAFSTGYLSALGIAEYI